MLELLTGEYLPVTMVLAGFIIGLYAIYFQGSMLWSLPFFQLVAPAGTSVGTMVGAIKVGSVSRGLFSSAATWKSLNLRALPKYIFLFIGSGIGAFGISSVKSDYTILVVLLAILITVLTQQIVRVIHKHTAAKQVAALFVGLYGGFFGAGISLLIVPVMRVIEPDKYGTDDKIFLAKMQALFIEFLIAIVAISGHIAAATITVGNWGLWLWWGLGSGAAGIVGGLLLEINKHADKTYQRLVLYSSFAIAILVALLVRFNVFG